MILRIHEIVNDDVLAGGQEGVAALTKIINAYGQGDDSMFVILDFAKVLVATGSFLRECVLGFRAYCLHREPRVAVVVGNASPKVIEELQNLLKSGGDAIAACDLTPAGTPRNARVVGSLEDKQRMTLEAVLRFEPVDAGALHERFSRTEKIGVTGWNNRLAALVEKGILIEERTGRAKQYRPVVKELRYGS